MTAYEQLVAEGYIRGEGRKGYFVNTIEQIFIEEETIPYQKRKNERTDRKVDFRAGSVDQHYFPLKAWRQIANQILQLKESYVYGEPFSESIYMYHFCAYFCKCFGTSRKSIKSGIIMSKVNK